MYNVYQRSRLNA